MFNKIQELVKQHMPELTDTTLSVVKINSMSNLFNNFLMLESNIDVPDVHNYLIQNRIAN